MHDPMTVAHEIKYPWFRHRPWPKKFRHSSDKRFTWRRMQHEIPVSKLNRMDSFWDEGYRETFITIWHVDPEKDGSDDSCGWAWPKLTKRQKNILHNVAWSEGHNPHFLRCLGKEWPGSIADAESLHRGMALLVNRVLHLRLSFEQVSQYAAEQIHINSGVGKIGDAFCFLPGYHTNSTKDSKDDRERHFEGMLCGVARGLLDLKRHWWQHPKWHFWHWKIQCHPLGTFKRWAFSRCSKCGGRFAWGYSPLTNSWNGTGPLWFRSEKDTFHADCNRPTDNCCASSEPLDAKSVAGQN